jgi:hypothetical protein
MDSSKWNRRSFLKVAAAAGAAATIPDIAIPQSSACRESGIDYAINSSQNQRHSSSA